MSIEWFVLLGVVFWMGQFIWFPDGDKLLELFVRDAEPPNKASEVWAMQLYQETFSPDCGASWVQRLMVYISWASWFFLCALAILASLSVAGLLPKAPVTFWLVLSDMVLYALAMLFLLLLLFGEMLLLYRKGVPLDFRSRRAQWLCVHPSHSKSWPSGKLPWWFWLDGSASETLLRMMVFLGGFLVSVAALFYFSHLNEPKMVTVENFWDVLFLWTLAIVWLAIPLTIWLSHLDWTHRHRDILLLWASKQR